MLGGVGGSPGQPGPYPDRFVRRLRMPQRSIRSRLSTGRVLCDSEYVTVKPIRNLEPYFVDFIDRIISFRPFHRLASPRGCK